MAVTVAAAAIDHASHRVHRIAADRSHAEVEVDFVADLADLISEAEVSDTFKIDN